MRKASSSLTSIPDDARTSVSSAASVALSAGRDGGPIVPGAGGGGGGGAADVGVKPLRFIPFGAGDGFCGSCRVPKLGEA